ncbi:MAG: tRNA modification GTPase, partial [Cyclobacteriaceae bacterium]
MSRESNNVVGGVINSKVNYKSIEFPLGLRHYFYLNDDASFHVNLSYVLDFSSNSSIEFLRSDGSTLEVLDLKSRRNFALGVGYKYRNRYNLELRYQTNRDILGEYIYWSSNYNSLSMILGYSI